MDSINPDWKALEAFVVNNQDAIKSHTKDWWGALKADYIKKFRSGKKEAMIKAIGPAGLAGDGPEIGQTRRVYGCTTTYGRKRKMNMKRILNDMLVHQKVSFQWLNTGNFRLNGIIPLNSRYHPSIGVWPRTIAYPVYVFRMNVPIGDQATDTGLGPVRHFPVVAFRLTSHQAADGEPFSYRWTPCVGLTGGSTAANTNSYEILQSDTDVGSFNSYYHGSTVAEVMFTAPQQFPADVEVSVVRFTGDDYAPPDLFTDQANDYSVWRTNSGYSTDQPSEPSEDATSMYYNTWLHNKISHPLAHAERVSNAVSPAPFVRENTHKYTLCARSTISADSRPVQHLHKHVVLANRWHDSTLLTADVTQVQPTNDYHIKPILTQDHPGVWISPTDQRWLMVCGWTRGGILDTPGLLATEEPSFDVRLTTTFKFVETEH